MNDNWIKTVGRIGPIAILAIASSKPAFAQIIPDRTLGNENSVVVPINTQLEHIQGGALRGTNLFHSFQDFNIKEGHSAYFVNPAAIQNIFSRVTGVNPSHILGKLGVLGEANLYLINPNGIIFGDNASLDIKGGFVASTASSFAFPDGSQYSAVNPEIPPVLINNVPIQISLQFEGEPATIVNAGHLQAGGNITLAGGMVVNTGQISAPENTVNLLAVQPETTVRMSDRADILEVIEPTVASELESNLEALEELSEETGLRVTETGDYEILGTGITISPETGLTIASGEIEATGGTVRVLGNKVGLVDANIDVSGANGGGTVHIGGSDRGQNSLLNAEQTWVNEGTNITADALGEGDGGTAIVWADKATAFYGNISARGGNIAGDGGFVEISGKENLLFEGRVDVGTNQGNAGTLLLDPKDIRIVSSGSANDAQLPNIPFAQNQNSDYTILKMALMNATGDIMLQATNNIIIEDIGDLTFNPGANFVTFEADADGDGSGNFIMNDVGDSLITIGRDLTISGVNIIAGNLDTSVNTGDNIQNVISDAGGNIKLTATQGSIITGNLYTYSSANSSHSLGTASSGMGGYVYLEARDAIAIGTINTSSIAEAAKGVDSGVAGNVRLTTITGDIQTNAINTFSRSYLDNNASSTGILNAQAQTSGTVKIATINGNIQTRDIDTSSLAFLFNSNDSILGLLAATGTAGDVQFNTTNGNIQTGKIDASSFANITNFDPDPNAGINIGKAGEVNLNATNGRIQTDNIDTSTVSGGGIPFTAGDAGNVTLIAKGDIMPGTINANSIRSNAADITLVSNNGTIQTTGGNINAGSFSENGGNITLNSWGDITLANVINSSGLMNGGDVKIISRNGSIDGSLFAINTGEISGTNTDVADALELNLPPLIPRNTEDINGGNVILSAARNIKLHQGFIDTSGKNITQNLVQRGMGGLISIESGNKIDFNQVLVNSDTEFGNGANLEITGRSLSMYQSSIEKSSDNIAEQSGDIIINTPEYIEINQDSSILIANRNTARSNNLIINKTNQLTIQNSLIGTFANTTDLLGGKAGNIVVNTDRLNISGASSNGLVPGGLASLSSRQGRSGEVIVKADLINLSDGGGIAGTSAGIGVGGDITIDANSVYIHGASETQLFSSGILADALTEGTGGNINITTDRLTLENGGVISTSTFGTGSGGTVNLNTPEILLTGTSEDGKIKTGIYAQSFDAGDAGSINMTATNLNLENSAKISVSSDPQAEDSGNLINRTNAWINAIAVQDSDDSVTEDFRVARGTGNGDAGNIDLFVREQMTLNNQVEVVAETSSGDGGNINMDIGNLLLMRRESKISTTAGTARAGGNGGNITIDIADGFIVAPPHENNDITANAFEGNGGNINITTQAIFGLKVRDELTPLSDITASSEFGLDGTVQLNTLGIDPTTGLTNLPEDETDPQVGQGCSPGGANASSLNILGTRGASDSPDDMLTGEIDGGFISLDELETDGEIEKDGEENGDARIAETRSLSTSPCQ